MTITKRIFNYFFENVKKASYTLISEVKGKEEIYYSKFNSKFYIIIKDEELGRSCYNIISEMYKRASEIKGQFEYIWNFKINRFLSENKSVYMISGKCVNYKNVVEFEKNQHKELTYSEKIKRALQRFDFTIAMNKNGYYLNKQRLNPENLNTFSGFISSFEVNDSPSESVLDSNNFSIIEQIHNEFCPKKGIKEFYNELARKGKVNDNAELPYGKNIMEICYNYYYEVRLKVEFIHKKLVMEKVKYEFAYKVSDITVYEKIFEDEYATHYKIKGEDYCLKIYKENVDLKQMEKNLDWMLAIRTKILKEILKQKCFIPYKKAYYNYKFIGYIYQYVDLSKQNIIEIRDKKIANVPKAKMLIRLINQMSEIIDGGIYSFSQNPFTKVLILKSEKDQVQVVNIDFLSAQKNNEKNQKYIYNYLKLVIGEDNNLSNLNFSLTEEPADLDWVEMELGKLSVALKSYIKTHTKFCKVHKMYYNNDFIVCPKCFPNEKDIEKEDLEEIIRNVKSIGEGGEAEIYPYRREYVIKKFKEQVDINTKVVIIAKVLSKKNILEAENQKNLKYHYIIPEKLVVGENKLGYIMKKVEGQDIIVLRDRKIVYKYGFKRKDILEILIAMGEGIETLHSKANIFIGDLNGGNVLFDKNKNVYFLDFDGMGIDDIVPDYLTKSFVDPISQKNNQISMKDDWYSFAIQAFYYLTNVHPFKGRYLVEGINMDITERMEKRISILGDHNIEIPTIAEPWNWMNNNLQDKFLSIFEGSDRESIVPLLIEQYKILYHMDFDLKN